MLFRLRLVLAKLQMLQRLTPIMVSRVRVKLGAMQTMRVWPRRLMKLVIRSLMVGAKFLMMN
jgi:hypothetical protein